ncbi:DNA mismatch repair protein MutS [Heliorestis acidaminivorans]|uniref:DNA mismatch repair protein MutS n=1 Tax=Heliorestis acidaminivorans TaxID=553427 RepID=A0A6I0ETJ6_9FIRM|nr:DNA mismatch repair protein MutS [Heliorestis acidaminivorans]KAB2953409.1 DNA mismatch repair protein MutS [Heliorestis acidaminivorans]
MTESIMSKDIAHVYQKRRDSFHIKYKEAKEKSNRLATLRMITALIALGLFGYGYFYNLNMVVVVAVAFTFAFVALVKVHRDTEKKALFFNKMEQINEDSLARLENRWFNFVEDGSAYIDEDHPYTSDLNIFGRASLFQHINVTTTLPGQNRLAMLLAGKQDGKEVKPLAGSELLSRQQAVQELASLLEWRQHFQAVGMDKGREKEDPQKIIGWVESPRLSLGKLQRLLIILLPVLTITTFVLANYQFISSVVPTLLLLLQIIYVALTAKGVKSAYDVTDGAVAELERYASLLKLLENQTFRTDLLKKMAESIQLHQGGASKQLKSLSAIVEWSYFRHSTVLHFILNNLLFWDLHVLKRLEKWKEENGKALHDWLNAVTEFEVLASLAILAHDHPDWAFPEVLDSEDALLIDGKRLGHPLISNDSRICNDATLENNQSWIITGSNMSGKSTFLRTIGINLVLAYVGAPACAQSLRCSRAQIYTSMRIHDDLENHTSTFYAELKRIKAIVDASKADKPLVYMIDEIFRGTNSKDRIAGAKMVISRLCKGNTIGLVTTHDLELSALEEEKKGLIKNYHFTDRIIDEKIHFDYRLRSGVSTTTNAIALMKMVGLE